MPFERQANETIADMPGSEALPRLNGDLVFHDQWERRAFAMAVALSEAGHYPWDEFREHLMAAIAASGESPQNPMPQAPGYYEHWLASLERVLADRNIVAPSANESASPSSWAPPPPGAPEGKETR